MSTTVRTDPVLGPTRWPLALAGWEGVVVTALVPPAAMALLRSRRPGETVRVALAIADDEARPAYVGADRWRTDGRARVDARGTYGRTAAEPACSPGSLTVAGRRFPLDVGVDARPGVRLEVAGVLHVATDRGPFARPWTVRAWRRSGRDTLVDLAAPTGAVDPAGAADAAVVADPA